jgi:hypothetical protein
MASAFDALALTLLCCWSLGFVSKEKEMIMSRELTRRGFVKSAIAGCALCAGCSSQKSFFGSAAAPAAPAVPGFISPGCRGTKVRVGKIYAGIPGGLWPMPQMDLKTEARRYDAEFVRMKKDFADVDFVANYLVTTVEQARQAKEAMADVDGVLIIHLSMGINPILRELLSAGKPTVLFAAPYSGHEWTSFGSLEKDPAGAMLCCMLTSDTSQLAAAVRPFRAIHHLREARILNISTRPWPEEWTKAVTDKFGTQVVVISKERALKAYDSVPESQAQVEAGRWIRQAVAVVEPSRDEVVRSCRLALAFEKLLDEEKATVITADCYGTMYHQLPAFPCVGNVRLNDMGLGGICESDMRATMTHILFQSLTGRPGFVSDPTMDESKDAIILAHCLGSMKMDGPDGPAAPYKLRTIMERQEGCVPQVFMRVKQPVTQAILDGTDLLRYFTGQVIEVPDAERGCRTKITVRIDGSPERLWQNWSNGLHRVTVYGNIKEDLERFCRFKGIKMVDEAA